MVPLSNAAHARAGAADRGAGQTNCPTSGGVQGPRLSVGVDGGGSGDRSGRIKMLTGYHAVTMATSDGRMPLAYHSRHDEAFKASPLWPGLGVRQNA
jgi:hypothetical protein